MFYRHDFAIEVARNVVVRHAQPVPTPSTRQSSMSLCCSRSTRKRTHLFFNFKNTVEQVREFGLLVEEAPFMEADDESGSPNLPHRGSNLPALLVPLRHYNLHIRLRTKTKKPERTKINPKEEKEIAVFR